MYGFMVHLKCINRKEDIKMVKTITINGTKYDMKASAYTQFAYKNLTGRSFLADIQKLTNLKEDDLLQVDGLIEILLDISFVMIQENDPKKFTNEEEFIKSISNLFDEPQWIEDVIALAVTPLSGNLQKDK